MMVRRFKFLCVPEPQFYSTWQEECGYKVCVPAVTGCILLLLIIGRIKDFCPVVREGIPHNKGNLIYKLILVPFPLCDMEVNSAEERNGGKVTFLHDCAEQESGMLFWSGSCLMAAAQLVWCEAGVHRVPTAVTWLCWLH